LIKFYTSEDYPLHDLKIEVNRNDLERTGVYSYIVTAGLKLFP